MRLWSWDLSPFAGKVRVALAEKSIELELVEIDPSARPARLRELNPTNRVPVLEVDGVGIAESTVICEWLEETHPERPLWPQDAVRRAVARNLLRWVDDELTTNFFLSMRKQAFGLDATDHPELVEQLQSRLVQRWRALERLLGRYHGPWLAGGERPSLADLAAIPLAVRLAAWRPDLQPDPDALPLASEWLARLRDWPTAGEVHRKGVPADTVG